MTFPNDYKDHLSSENFPFDYTSKRSDWEYDAPERKIRNLGWTEYLEGVDVGYRYFCTKAPQKVSYPFGYGLSYTSFEWSEPSVRRQGDKWTVSVKVTNVGSCAGKDVVELYVSAPKSQMYKPAKELKAFAKTGLLAPGESCTLKMSISDYDLASFDEAKCAFVTDKGRYTLQLSRDAASCVLPLSIDVHKTLSWKVSPMD